MLVEAVHLFLTGVKDQWTKAVLRKRVTEYYDVMGPRRPQALCALDLEAVTCNSSSYERGSVTPRDILESAIPVGSLKRHVYSVGGRILPALC